MNNTELPHVHFTIDKAQTPASIVKDALKKRELYTTKFLATNPPTDRILDFYQTNRDGLTLQTIPEFSNEHLEVIPVGTQISILGSENASQAIFDEIEKESIK